MENREKKLYIGNENHVINIEVNKKISNKPLNFQSSTYTIKDKYKKRKNTVNFRQNKISCIFSVVP